MDFLRKILQAISQLKQITGYFLRFRRFSFAPLRGLTLRNSFVFVNNKSCRRNSFESQIKNSTLTEPYPLYFPLGLCSETGSSCSLSKRRRFPWTIHFLRRRNQVKKRSERVDDRRPIQLGN